MQKILSNKKAIALFMLPTMLLIGVLVIVPIGMSVYYSLLNWDGIGKSIFVGLRNYKDLLSDERFLNSVSSGVNSEVSTSEVSQHGRPAPCSYPT